MSHAVSKILDREVFQFKLSAITDEMSNSIRRAAYSPIIWDMLDYDAALLSITGEQLSQADVTPSLLGVLSSAYKGMVAALPLESWRPGDIVICNDPYRGCAHTPDMVLMCPIYHDGSIIAISAAIAHHVDIGGKLPSTTAPDNVEVFAEGLQIPPMKLVEAGVINPTIMKFIDGNVRNPSACAGDLAAQIAGCRTGEKRVLELVALYGLDRFNQLVEESLDYGERYARALLSELPRRKAYSEVLIEDDVSSSDPIKIAVTVEIKDGAIELDFTGTDAQRRNALNVPLASTTSMALYAVRCITSADGPSNGGRNRPVTIIVPPGSFLNPTRPAAVGNRHYGEQAVADAVLKALSEIVPERSSAGTHISYPTFRVGGFDTRPAIERSEGKPRYFIMHDIMGGGYGGHSKGDGIPAVDSHGSNCAVLSAEVVESTSAIRILRSELIDRSGGKGQHRGGLAIRREYEMLADNLFVSVFHQQGSARTAPWGLNGGEPGRPASAVLNPGKSTERVLSTKEIAMPVRAGDVIRLESAGGGGWGDPASRPEALEQQDRENGYF